MSGRKVVEVNSEDALKSKLLYTWPPFLLMYDSWRQVNPLVRDCIVEFSSTGEDLYLSNFFTDELNQRRISTALLQKIIPHLPNPTNADVRPCYFSMFYSSKYSEDDKGKVYFDEVNTMLYRYGQSKFTVPPKEKGLDAWSTSDKQEFIQKIRQVILGWEKYVMKHGQHRSPCIFKIEIFRLPQTPSKVPPQQEKGTYLKYA